jgi:SAM-dependent methyltransferase
MEPVPDWQLPAGVDRGLWDYLHAAEMVAGYDEQMAMSPLARADMAYCDVWFTSPGKLLDLGCGTGRLCRHFARKGYPCVGVDLSEDMLKYARDVPVAGIEFIQANLVNLTLAQEFDYAACLFSTLGMVRGAEHRARVLANALRALKPGGRFVLHVHNRYFLGLGRRSWGREEITMPQAYAGAPLTLHHFSLGEAKRLLRQAGFSVLDVHAVSVGGGRVKWPAALRAYGYLIAALRP